MKQKVTQQIDQMEKKYLFKKRNSTVIPMYKKIKTEPESYSTLKRNDKNFDE